MTYRGLSALMTFAAIAVAQPANAAEEGLQPYQLVRSLQLIQDRIAGGDHAALPMQAKVLEMIDARFRTASAEDLNEPKNFRALLVYGMSGGNPATVEAAVSRAGAGPDDHAIAVGVINYLTGRPAGAIETLKPVDPMALPPDIGAFLALVKGSLLAIEQPAEALKYLDEARLLSPGTLVEEAALRRTVGIAAEQGDAARFALASTQYAARFLYSPYASQFADAFVSGVVSLHMAISQEKVADITSMMDAEREKVVYLRIARRAAIDGMDDLSAFASAKAEQGRDGQDNKDDPRALLYASLSTVTSDQIDDIKAKLKRIDRKRLSENDRALLDAAAAIASELTAPPKQDLQPLTPPVLKKAPAPEAEQAPTAADEAELPPVEGAMPEDGTTAPAAEGATEAASSADASQSAPAALPVVAPLEAPDPKDPADATMIAARRQLEQVDQMLGAAPQ